MLVLWGTLAGLFLWLELIYHVSGFGFAAFNPFYTVFLIVFWAALGALLVGAVKGRVKKVMYYVWIWIPTLWVCIQLVYLRIFRQPLLLELMVLGGQDALRDYWKEALGGVLGAFPFLLLLILPAVFVPYLLKKLGKELPQLNRIQLMKTALLSLAGAAGCVVTLQAGKKAAFDFYELYHEFYDPLTLAQELGVFPLLQGDVSQHLGQMSAQREEMVSAQQEEMGSSRQEEMGSFRQEEMIFAPQEERESGYVAAADKAAQGKAEAQSELLEATQETEESSDKTAAEQLPVPHQFEIDFDRLHQLADNDDQIWLADYIQNKEPVLANEYTGMFAGYNLIFLTAEGFCPYAIDEKLTPTLYKLANSGFVCRNYYVPLWYTSTSDGEYVNMTGLIPDGQHSMRYSAKNVQPFVLPAFFASQGVYSWAYHDNTLSYYDRNESHPNMGYDFKACKLGKLSQEQWGDKIFEMEQPNQWPASDYNMMVATVPEYVGQERFHVYYMTVSGHMYYTFSGNAMSSKNKEAVADLKLSEKSRAYIACNIELDKAMENLIQQLTDAGQLEKTVICLSADHYPYSFTDEEYEELAGKDLSAEKDLYRNTLILWNAGMKEPIYIDKACSSLDLLPTLLNLFGFEYDSRMYAGNDILSDKEGMVVFNNRDFVTDALTFIEKGDVAVWHQDQDGNDIIPDKEKEAYLAAMRQEVKDRYKFSACILRQNYYSDILDALPNT